MNKQLIKMEQQLISLIQKVNLAKRINLTIDGEELFDIYNISESLRNKILEELESDLIEVRRGLDNTHKQPLGYS